MCLRDLVKEVNNLLASGLFWFLNYTALDRYTSLLPLNIRIRIFFASSGSFWVVALILVDSELNCLIPGKRINLN